MKIGIDISVLSVATGGLVTYTRALIENLLKISNGNEYKLVHAVSGCAPGWESSMFLLHGGAQILCWTGWGVSVVRKMPEPLKTLWMGTEAVLTRGRLKFQLKDLDIFHSSEVFLWDNRPGKNIITMHDITTVLFPQFHTEGNIRLHDRKITFAQRLAHRIVADSHNTKNDLIRYCGIPSKKIQVIYPGCDHARYHIYPRDEVVQVLQKYNLSQGYILHVGTVEPRKNIERLIEAFEILARGMGRPVERLVLVGSAGWLNEKIYRRIEISPLRERIVLTGPISANDLPYIYNGAAVFVYPSLYEGFGLPVVEAMACGVPVITSNTSSLPEVVGDAGILVDPYDAEAFAAAIHGALVDQDLRREMAHKAVKRAKILSWEKTAREMLTAYKEVVES